MKKYIIILLIPVIICGCTSTKPKGSGFLSDYSKLETVSGTSFRYMAPGNPLAGYSKFIIDPVQIRFYAGSEASKQQGKGKLKEEDILDLQNYMHEALVKAMEDRYEVVYRPGPGVARFKSAITDLKKSGIVQNIIPIGKVVGSGLGGATLEAELIDSVTGEQIGSIIESQLGSRLSLDGYSTWGDAKGIMDRWAKRFRGRLDEAHGNK